jgi:hypothetical protein
MSDPTPDVPAGDEPETWLAEARVIAAQCWCHDTTKHIEMIPELAEAIAHQIAAWMHTAALHARNEAYWRGRSEQVYEKCAEICDDISGLHSECARKIRDLDLSGKQQTIPAMASRDDHERLKESILEKFTAELNTMRRSLARLIEYRAHLDWMH